MPILKTDVPKLHRHAKGSAFIKVDGRQIWLGRWGDPATKEKYDLAIAKWLTNGRRMPAADPQVDEAVTVSMVLADFLRSIEARYGRADDQAYKAVVKLLRKLYGSTPAAAFGPRAFRVVRAEMVRLGWSRRYCNKQAMRLRRIFRWAVAEELVPADIPAKLAAVDPLKRGEATDKAPVKPVTRQHIRIIRRLVPLQVRALIDLQLLTGARADELVRLRATDITAKGEVWTAALAAHKTAHHGKARTLYFGPRAQRVLARFMVPGRPLDAHLFSPREAFAAAKAKGAKGARRENQKPNAKKSEREIGLHYTTDSYRRAIHAACTAAKIPVWGPHRLRHNAATVLRREFGIEAAQVILGHAIGSNITEIYAEKNESEAKRIIRKIG